MRDSQRQRVYRSENRARSTLEMGGHVFRDVSTLAAYKRRVNEIMGSKWMKTSFPAATRNLVHVEFSTTKRHGACAGYDGITTSVTPWALHEMVLIHELAHTIEKRTSGIYDPGHGRFYCQIYLRLVRRFVSKAAHDVLKAAFKDGRVKYTPKRKRTVPVTMQRKGLPPALAAANAARVAAAQEKCWKALHGPGLQVMGRHGWCVAEANLWTDYAGGRVMKLRSDYGRIEKEVPYSDLTPASAYDEWKRFLQRAKC
jgi:putative metallohydrolase (TIGR04338 family)